MAMGICSLGHIHRVSRWWLLLLLLPLPLLVERVFRIISGLLFVEGNAANGLWRGESSERRVSGQ